jgi:hypothetical protein
MAAIITFIFVSRSELKKAGARINVRRRFARHPRERERDRFTCSLRQNIGAKNIVIHLFSG